MAAPALALVAGSTVQHAGLSDASAGIALDDSHFIVANDEHNRLVYRRGLAQPGHEVDVGRFLGVNKEADGDDGADFKHLPESQQRLRAVELKR